MVLAGKEDYTIVSSARVLPAALSNLLVSGYRGVDGVNQAGGFCRIRLLYEGRVQGVGFRYRVSTIAKCVPVAGYVRNLPDGRVELVVEGGQEDVEDFLEQIRLAMKGLVERETRPKSLN